MADEITTKDKIDLAKFAAGAAAENIKIADTKATWMFGAIGVITGAFLGKIAKIDWSSVALGRSLVLLIASLLFIILAFKYTLFVLYPRLTKGNSSGLIYFEDIALQTADDYVKKYEVLTSVQLAENYYRQAHTLSSIASRKFKALRVGMIHTVITIPLLITAFIII
jgi:hypothetical protein